MYSAMTHVPAHTTGRSFQNHYFGAISNAFDAANDRVWHCTADAIIDVGKWLGLVVPAPNISIWPDINNVPGTTPIANRLGLGCT